MGFRYHASLPGAKREWRFQADPHGIFCLRRQLLPDEKEPFRWKISILQAFFIRHDNC
jgi:hypothetical protein